MKTLKQRVSTVVKLDNVLSREALDRIAVEDIIPTESQINRILPVLWQILTAKLCKRCSRLEHPGKCVAIRRS